MPQIVFFSPKNIICHMSEVLRQRLQEQRLQAATGSSDDQTLILSARWSTLLVCCIGVSCNVSCMMDDGLKCHLSAFLNITSCQCKTTGWKWQLESNQLSRDAQKLGIIPVRDIEGKPAFWSTQVYPGNVFPTSRCVAHSMQWNVVLKMTLANHQCGCLILIDLNICQTTIQPWQWTPHHF